MEKMFKRTLLGAAVMTAALASTSANAAIDLLDGNVQLYGQAAGSLQVNNPKNGDSSAIVEMESRIGFRGKVEFDNFAPAFIWQIESGNAGKTWDGKEQGSFGFRDTFVGLEFDGTGSVKFGRQLVAAYNYVDWPHSNPGLGNVFDWNNDIGAVFQDRADNVIRFDSANFGGFNFQATASGMDKNVDQVAYSMAGSYTAGAFTLHGGYYAQDNLSIAHDDYGTILSNNYSILGGALYLGDVTLSGAAKYMVVDTSKGENNQWAYSATAQYIAGGKWLYKVGAALTSNAEIAGVEKENTEDLAVTGRVGYLLPSAILYTDVRYRDMQGDDESADTTNVFLGVEYYF